MAYARRSMVKAFFWVDLVFVRVKWFLARLSVSSAACRINSRRLLYLGKLGSRRAGKLYKARSQLAGWFGGGGGGRPDYLQKLKVPEGYEKMIDDSNI